MPGDFNDDVKVTKDNNGKVRQLSYRSPYQPNRQKGLEISAGFAETPRTVAEKFLRDTAPVFGFAPAEVDNFSAFSEKTAGDSGVELRFKEEKQAVASATAVDYAQTIFGLPIWGAGVTVRIDNKRMGVTGAHNASHYDIKAHRPSATAPFLPHLMREETVAGLLGITENIPQLTINATSALVYEYEIENRLDPQIESHEHNPEMTGLTINNSFPKLPLPPVPESIEPGIHYVVTEVLFSFPYEGWGRLNWRAFIEPDTGAVLYLRALVSCARTAIFPTDPVTATGQLLSTSSAIADLDALRIEVPLFGLKSPVPPALSQQMDGEFVKLTNLEPPATSMPLQNPPYDFFYSCNTPDFAACNAYYHCDNLFRMLKGMGIDVNNYFNNTNFPVPVDPHAQGGQVNAAAQGNVSGNGLGAFVFGVAQRGSAIGIASDPRVVWHEFGHAILWDHVNSPNFGFAHSPGDSLAAILYDPISKAQDRFETFPFMKLSAGLTRRHDRKVEDGWGWFGSKWDRQYGGEQVLSTTMFRIYRAAGGDNFSDHTERQFASRYLVYLILKAVSLLSFTTPDPDLFVDALTEADGTTDLFEGHPGGAFSKVFRWSFEKQGLYQSAQGPVTTTGAPPEIDIYIEDGRKGEYTYAQTTGGETEIWNRLSPDNGTEYQKPVTGTANYAYVCIRNRGTQTANGVTVTGFRSKVEKPRLWPLDWESLSSINSTAVIKPGDKVVVGPFSWIPQHDGAHLLFSASTLGDRSNMETIVAGPILTSRLVLLDNNIGQRAFE
jgi:hypothetical protein